MSARRPNVLRVTRPLFTSSLMCRCSIGTSVASWWRFDVWADVVALSLRWPAGRRVSIWRRIERMSAIHPSPAVCLPFARPRRAHRGAGKAGRRHRRDGRRLRAFRYPRFCERVMKRRSSRSFENFAKRNTTGSSRGWRRNSSRNTSLSASAKIAPTPGPRRSVRISIQSGVGSTGRLNEIGSPPIIAFGQRR